MSFTFKSNYPQIARESGFKLRQFRDGPLDWRLIGSIEIDRILREQQFENIDAILYHLSEAPLTSMLDSNVLDSGVSKYFTLSQLALQYLIFCRKFLDETVRTLRGNMIDIEKQNNNLKAINQEQSIQLSQLHKKINQIEAINEIVFPCHYCTKNFVSNDALNVHLSKKHINKSPSIEIQGRDNDRTLINTIKLELEIKQLKERLNIAEKDIRETVEKKKAPCKDVVKISSSTQMAISTQSIGTQSDLVETNIRECTETRERGTQSNLFETKESDCTEYVRIQSCVVKNGDNCAVNVKDLESLSEIQEKVSKLETWKETHNSESPQFITEITHKLAELTECLQSQRKQDAENLTKIAKDAILSSISSNQTLAASSPVELQEILSNMFSEVLQVNAKNINQIVTKIEKSYEQKICSLMSETEKSREKIVVLDSQSLINMDSMKPRNESTEDKVSVANISQKTYSVNVDGSSKGSSNDTRSDDSTTDVSDDHESSQCSSYTTKQKATKHPKAIRQFEKKMALYGLNTNSKNLSASEAATISAHLSKQQNSLKKVYPRFYATRNRLKKVVDLLSFKKLDDLHLSQDKNHEEVKTKKQKNDLPQTTNERNAFKQRLEKILNSPINKPTNYISNNDKQPSKPVPLPRKHVMFYNDERSSDDR